MQNRNKFITLFIFCVSIAAGLFLFTQNVYADYVLPYPSYMPGNKLYWISRIIDKLNYYWYFGNISQVKYHMSLADKYLVEAKTLFEYNQYLLAEDALKRSTVQYAQIMPYVIKAQEDGKDMTRLINDIHEESIVHKKVLQQLLGITPEQFLWQPERTSPTELFIHKDIEDAINHR